MWIFDRIRADESRPATLLRAARKGRLGTLANPDVYGKPTFGVIHAPVEESENA